VTIGARRANLAIFLGVVLLATGLTVAFAAPRAGAQPKGDNGTVKIHRSTTPVTDRRNEPHVCVFYLDAFGFDPGQSVSWQIKSWPPTGDRSVVTSGALALNSSGGGRTGDMTLQDGHYKLFWNFTGEHGFAKQKVFWVSCAAPSPKPTPTPTASPTPTPTVSPTTPPSPTPTVSPTTPASPTPPAAPAPSPVHATLPVTG
jgi:hypothetical protein